MEEILVVAIQIFFEFGIQFFSSPIIDFSFGDRVNKGCVVVVVHMLLGGGLGWLSTLLFPKFLLPIAALRIANLLLGPVLAGGISYFASKSFLKQEPWTGFLHGYLFSLMFAMARYATAHQ